MIYLLHGFPGFPAPGVDSYDGPATLFSSAGADDAAQSLAITSDQPVVLIAPVISPIEADTECVDGVQGRWQTYLTEDVPAWTSAHPRLRTGSESPAIGGFPLGGYCAQIAALRHPGQYGVAGNLSGTIAADYPADQGGVNALTGMARVQLAGRLSSSADVIAWWAAECP